MSGHVRVGEKLRLRTFALALVVVAVACATPPSASPPGAADGGAATVEGGSGGAPSYTVLPRSAHPLARPDLEVGRLDPNKRIENLSVVFKLTPEQVADRAALLAAVIGPGSPDYHQWLTPEAYAVRFGAKPADIARVSAWLASQGLDVHPVPSRLGARVGFSGTVAGLEAAFRTQMNRYLVRGATHYAMSPAPSVPTDLADVILAIHNTHDFYPRAAKPKIKVNPAAVCPTGDDFCSGDGIAPPDWANIYDVNSLYSPGIAGTKITGVGVTIAVVGISEISQTDLTAFRTRYGLATNPITMTLVPDTGAGVGDNGAGLEAVLDTEWSGGIAPAATINYVYTGANDTDVDDATYYAIEQNFGGVLSESWAGCEEGSTPADADVLETFGSAASLLGITYVAASGDDGAAACSGEGGLYVNMPASFPGVTGVGGTGFAIPGGLTFSGGTATGYGTETVWNEFHDAYTADGVAAGGGGISAVFARPSFQGSIPTCTSLGTLPTGVTPSAMREVPDVALTAASGSSQYGYFVECTFDTHADDCTDTGTDPVVVEVGGTSASTPSFAGVMALANQATGGRLGNVNPLLYTLNTTTPGAFHDITTGNNEVTCKATDPGCPAGKLYGYAATTGYDCASGLGSIDATHLVTAWATLTPTATTLASSASTTSEGTSVTLTATVDVLGTNSNALGGIVTFNFESFLANGDLDQSWTLGTAAITGGTTTSGSASLATAIPEGMVNSGRAVDVVAMYGGDANHLASVSALVPITFSPVSTLCSSPPTVTLKAGGTDTFTSEGGVPPVRWYIDDDTTCNADGDDCSTLNVTSGAFVAGTGQAGWVVVAGLDSDGAEVFVEVTVGNPTGTAPWAAGSGILTNACCTLITTCPAPDNCGTISNGCSGTLSCGTCTAPQTCGGGGTPNVCGSTCTPITTCPAPDNCGTISNGCSGTLNCGTCTAPQTCGGGGTPNECGCTPIATCPAGDNCGTVSNGCGGTLSCGTCAAPQTCGGSGVANHCGCTPITTCPAGDNCGTVPNGCGGTLTCGACAAPDTCGGSGVANQCGCTPITTCPAGDNCGTVPNGCGGTLSCAPGCTSDETCSGNKCVAIPADGGKDSGADSGKKDSGSDGDGTADAGGHTDGGEKADGGRKGDSGEPDSGKGEHDGATKDAESDATADGGGEAVEVGACGCRTAKPTRTSEPALASVGALLLLGGARTRRRRAVRRD
jgi:hypothetical protein